MPSPRSPMLVAFVLILGLLIALVQLDFIEYAYEKMGVAPQYVFAVLIASLLGSSINLPIGRMGGAPAEAAREWPAGGPEAGTVLAVNVGGAVIPTLLSLYLLRVTMLWLPATLAVAITAAIVHRMAKPVPGVGIMVPVFIPPLVAAAAALLLAPTGAPAVAYVAGTLGTLIGADLTNLGRLRAMGAPIASIGGAGTFDGIFVTGILAVLLA